LAFTVTNLGTGSSTTGATAVITIGAAAPLKTVIVVASNELNTGGVIGGSITDTGGNTYTAINGVLLNNAAANGFVRLWRAFVTTALISTNTITYTKQTTAVATVVSAFVVQGTTGLVETSATNFGTGTAVSLTPANAHGNSLAFAFVGYGNAGTYTQSANYATPFTAITVSTTRGLGGGNATPTTTAPPTFAPTLGTTGVWGAVSAGLLPSLPIAPGGDAGDSAIPPTIISRMNKVVAYRVR
jgi:hypothetical protein